MNEQQYHYVVQAKIIDGKFAGWFIDYDSTDVSYPKGNCRDVETESYSQPDNRVDSNLILDLGARLMDDRDSMPVAKNETNLPPW